MRTQGRHLWIQYIKSLYDHFWLPIFIGIIFTLLFLLLWQQILEWEQLHIQQLVKGQLLLPPIVLKIVLTFAWGSALIVYLIQRAQEPARRVRKIN